MRDVLRRFLEWHSNHFGDFTAEVNAELLCLANDAERSMHAPEERAIAEELRRAVENYGKKDVWRCELLMMKALLTLLESIPPQSLHPSKEKP
jgi:hypothetical protein